MQTHATYEGDLTFRKLYIALDAFLFRVGLGVWYSFKHGPCTRTWTHQEGSYTYPLGLTWSGTCDTRRRTPQNRKGPAWYHGEYKYRNSFFRIIKGKNADTSDIHTCMRSLNISNITLNKHCRPHICISYIIWHITWPTLHGILHNMKIHSSYISISWHDSRILRVYMASINIFMAYIINISFITSHNINSQQST